MSLLRTIVSALALFLCAQVSSGCTFMLWHAALESHTVVVEPAEVASAWMDDGRVFHLGVRFTDGVVEERLVAAADLTPADGLSRGDWIGAPAGSRAAVEPVRVEGDDAFARPDVEGRGAPDARGAAWLVRRHVGDGSVVLLDLVEGRRYRADLAARTTRDTKIPIAAAIAATPFAVAGDLMLIGLLALLDDDDCDD